MVTGRSEGEAVLKECTIVSKWIFSCDAQGTTVKDMAERGERRSDRAMGTICVRKEFLETENADSYRGGKLVELPAVNRAAKGGTSNVIRGRCSK
jgi:hypothetical protein